MFRRLCCFAAALGMLMALTGPAMAGEDFGSLRVTLQNGETVVPDGAVTLYWVGDPREGGYRLSDTFGGGIIRQEDALSPALAQWLAEMAGEDGLELKLENGSAEFDELPEGLYLLKQRQASTGYHKMQPMMVMMPCEYQWHIESYPMMEEITWELPPTGQSPAPFYGLIGMVLSGTALLICVHKKRKFA